VGQVVVDHQFEVVHVDAAGCDVRRHQEAEGPLLEAFHDAGPLRLGHAAVQPFRGAAAGCQLVGQLLYHPLRVAEDEAAAHVVKVDHPADGGELLMMPHLEIGLVDQGAAGDGLLVDGDDPRVAGVPADQGLDGGRESGREERRLPCGGGGRQQLLHVLLEAEVEHPVRLVEDQQPQRGQVERAAGEVVGEPPRCAHHEVGAAFQLGELPLIGGAAVDRHRPQRLHEAAERAGRGRDLHRQLPGRRQDQHLGRPLAWVDAFERGNAEGRGLARPGLRLADDVVSRQQQGDRGRLDRRHAGEAELVDGPQYVR
jgi:hypothetical protein